MYTVPIFRRLHRACNKKLFQLLGSPTKRACNAQSVLQSLATIPYSIKKSNLLPTCSRCTAVNHYSATTTKIGSCEFQLHCIEFNVPRTNFSIKQLRGENVATEPNQLQLYPRAVSLRPNRVLFVLAIFNRVIDEKMLAVRLRTSAT